MNWYYVDAGQQAGPVTEADFQILVSTGKIVNETLVWREGLTEWKPYSQISGGSSQPPVPGGFVCAECGNSFTPDNVVRFGDQWVCAACKPTYVQKMREGVATGTARGGYVPIETVLARDYEVNIGECYNKATALYKANFGNVFGTTLAVLAISFVCGMIPFGIGTLAKLLIGGPLMGGLYYFYLRLMRGESVSTGDAFSGFKSGFVNLMLTNVVSSILSYICLLPGGLMMGLGVMAAFMGKRIDPKAFNLQMTGTVIAGIIVLGLGFCATMYLATCWFYALPLVADKKLGFWQAMQVSRKVITKHWWSIFGLCFVSGLLTLVGILGCGIGVLFTIPLTFLMLMTQYERLFGDLQPVG